MNEIKIFLQPEFEYYNSLLLTHAESLIDNFKNKLLIAEYDDTSRILEFGTKSYFNTSMTTKQ